jgi:hypothetical protein
VSRRKPPRYHNLNAHTPYIHQQFFLFYGSSV